MSTSFTRMFTEKASTIRIAVAAASAVIAAIVATPAVTAAVGPPANGPVAARTETPGDKPGLPDAGTGKPIPGRYVVTLRQGESPRAVAAIAKVTPTYVYENALTGFAAELNHGQLNALRQNRAVRAIEPDQEIGGEAYSTQALDVTGQPWGLDRIDQRSGLSRTYSWWASGSYGAGTAVRAYVIDSGIATAHADFGGRAQNLYDAFGGNGQDCNGHGTHVAGTIGGFTHGVAKSVLLRGIRVLDCNNSGSTAGLIAGVDYVYRNALKPAVANISVGAGFSSAVNTAVSNLVNSGVFVAVAAGNGDQYSNPVDACTTSPASAAGTLTVASANWYDTKASDSNFGACVDLYAPGVLIRSTWLNGTTNTISGTSMATPHVTGVAALLKSDWGDQPSTTIASWILDATTTNAIWSNVAGTPNRLLYMGGW
jgi:subtilisin family serine protease